MAWQTMSNNTKPDFSEAVSAALNEAIGAGQAARKFMEEAKDASSRSAEVQSYATDQFDKVYLILASLYNDNPPGLADSKLGRMLRGEFNSPEFADPLIAKTADSARLLQEEMKQEREEWRRLIREHDDMNPLTAQDWNKSASANAHDLDCMVNKWTTSGFSVTVDGEKALCDCHAKEPTEAELLADGWRPADENEYWICSCDSCRKHNEELQRRSSAR